MSEWIIDADGMLVSYSLGEFREGPEAEVIANLSIRFEPLDNPTQIELPDPGTSLAWRNFSLLDRLPLLSR